MKLTSSVIVISHDPKRRDWLEETLNSVNEQTHRANRVLLITSYNAYPVAQERVECIHVSPIKYPDMAKKLNIAIGMTWTDAVLPLADDDLIDRYYLEKTLSAMEEHKVDIVFTNMEMFGVENRIVECGEYNNIKNYNTLPITSLFKRKVWENHQYRSIDYLDWDFWWSAFEHGFSAHHIKEPLFKYRTHENQWCRRCNVDESIEEVRHAHS